MLTVKGSTTLLVVNSITRCVGGLLATRLDILMPLMVLATRSTLTEGVSVTHGSPRQHIWTFVAGFDEQTGHRRCPCITGNTAGRSRIPSFVGQNYFCESGLTRYSDGINYPFFPNGDPLWDGQGCGPTSSCCTFNSPPWFNVGLPSPTTDDIEVRICSSHLITNEDTPIQLMELYVK